MPSSDTFLVIDDEPQIRRAVRNALATLGARVLEAGTGREGLALASSERPELIVLDLGLPDMQGADVCRGIRSWGQMPIIVLSSRHDEEEKVTLLTAGADDYVTKPFSLRELVARAQVHLRRAAALRTPAGRPVLSLGTISIDFDAHRVMRAGEPVRLTAKEWKLLTALASHAGRTMTHREIFDAVWGRAGSQQQHLRVHLTNLRRKLEADPSNPVLIVTEPGVGYRLELPPDVESGA